jgi:hypothetical protein
LFVFNLPPDRGILQEETMKIATLILLALMIMLPTVPLLPEPPQRDVPAEMEAARRGLEGARNDLVHAGGDWGGHRMGAVSHIDAALKEIGEAEKWARAHHDIK